MKDFFKAIFSIIAGTGRFITGIRNLIVNIIFFGIIGLLIYGYFYEQEPLQIPENSIVSLTLSGDIVEERRRDPGFDRYLEEYMGFEAQPQTMLLSDILDFIETAAYDDYVSMLVLNTKNLGNVGLDQLQVIGEALVDFQAQGKEVVAVQDMFTQKQYMLATYASTIIINPMGGVALQGFGSYGLYFNELLNKLKVNYNVFRVGEYKSAIEPITRNSMSKEAREQNSRWLANLWGEYKDIVASQRDVSVETLDGYINNFTVHLRQAGGDTAAVALNMKLVDKVLTRNELKRYLNESVGNDADEPLNLIKTSSYFSYIGPTPVYDNDFEDSVAIIVAEGNIVGGKQPAGIIGSESLSVKIRKAKDDDSVKAVVLRINTGGGSAFASEVIRQELLELKKAGKPVVVSMGAMTASGGYWISADADTIIASPSTLTGSIGIFGAIPTFEKSLAEVGVYSDGVGTTPFSSGLDITQQLSRPIREAIQLTVENGYDRFLDIVANGREMDREKVALLAEGRVYSGTDALEIGLVDKLGNLEDAVEDAANLAGLSDYSTRYIERESSFGDLLIDRFTGVMAAILPEGSDSYVTLLALAEKFRERGVQLPFFSDPAHVYAHSMLTIKI